MTRLLLTVAALSFALAGCGGEATSSASSTSGAGSTSSSGSGGGGTSVSSGSSTGSTAPMGHSISLNAKFIIDEGQVAFMTPGANVTKVSPESIVGKHYLIGVFPAGFSPGNDPSLDSLWGTVPESLSVSFKTPSTYKDGGYDVVFVTYRSTEITADNTGKPIEDAPPAKNGDVATFRLDTSNIHMGDPTSPLGSIRVYVSGADATLSVENRWARDLNNMAEVAAAFNDTIMLVP